ncbi:MAG TPA: AAA family ATPase [Candidatus Paceibacterota bacterium]|nr:AAA family ATPase [Candidatus Paceibacterota bacterium]HPT40512.1 AAA family ATPase [Candidatus Paceibacterota bacterium]
MKLKSLEILGFKSFANKTIFSFPANVTAVVGPNGSGKSNVADAIRWVLGERDLKGLRVARSEEIIFGGTPNKPRMSLAQVSITLDNSDNSLPIDFKEVVISRRINRDGETDYLINQSSVRLKDIVELLAKAKIGSQGMTIVNQGSADSILKASAKERRLMIEESLGLREFQLKKEEAKRRLVSTEENLSKTRSLLEELLPHLRSLRRQVGRWEKREEIVNGLGGLEKIFFGSQFKEIYLGKNENEEKVKSSRITLEKEESILVDLEKQFEDLNKKRPDFSQEFKNIRNNIEKLEQEKGVILRELGNIEGQLQGIKRLASQRASFKPNFQEIDSTLRSTRDLLGKILDLNDLETLHKELQQIIVKIDSVFEKEKEDNSANEEVDNLEKTREEISQKIKSFDEKIRIFNNQLDELRKKDEQTGADSHDILMKTQKQRSYINSLNQQINELILVKERMEMREADLLLKLKETGLNASDFVLEKVKDLDAVEAMREQDFGGTFNDLEMKIMRMRHDLSAIGEVDELLIKEAKETEDRYQFLSKELGDLEKAKIDLEVIIDELTEKIDNEFSASLKVINDEFNKYFRIMFGGGKARLAITKVPKRTKKADAEAKQEIVTTVDNGETGVSTAESVEDDKEFEPGIEFHLDLPKKKINSLEVLSGGERSLISISALFAIVSAMHPPFVVLDEVDAALDEANARRFSKILGELVAKTQFVVITHNRSTMESAQIMYGISMAEEGISRAISVKLEEF